MSSETAKMYLARKKFHAAQMKSLNVNHRASLAKYEAEKKSLEDNHRANLAKYEAEMNSHRDKSKASQAKYEAESKASQARKNSIRTTIAKQLNNTKHAFSCDSNCGLCYNLIRYELYKNNDC